MATIYGTTGSDTRNGTSGNDTLYGWARGGNANSPSGNDILNGSFGDDILNGGTGNDSLFGGAGNDSLIGNDGNDVLQGNASDDALVGGLGRDILTGGDGADRFYFNSPDEGIDTITDFTYTIDEIWISAEGFGIDIDSLDAVTTDILSGALFVEDTQIATVSPSFSSFAIFNGAIIIF
ncbi:calcium-binding protein [Nostoc sp. HG1]|nr:calcium-binding protein [Nostoc sp. HG1]